MDSQRAAICYCTCMCMATVLKGMLIHNVYCIQVLTRPVHGVCVHVDNYDARVLSKYSAVDHNE